eukprot:jgi/Tetstr1/423529/TSEL_014202.t1
MRTAKGAPELITDDISKYLHFDRAIRGGNIAGVDRVKDSVVLDKPIYMGAAILDLSKLLMFRFHYDVIKARYGAAARLLFTERTSLCYHIETDDVYADMGQMAGHFDTSGYPKEHPLYSAAKKGATFAAQHGASLSKLPPQRRHIELR